MRCEIDRGSAFRKTKWGHPGRHHLPFVV